MTTGIRPHRGPGFILLGDTVFPLGTDTPGTVVGIGRVWVTVVMRDGKRRKFKVAYPTGYTPFANGLEV